MKGNKKPFFPAIFRFRDIEWVISDPIVINGENGCIKCLEVLLYCFAIDSITEELNRVFMMKGKYILCFYHCWVIYDPIAQHEKLGKLINLLTLKDRM